MLVVADNGRLPFMSMDNTRAKEAASILLSQLTGVSAYNDNTGDGWAFIKLNHIHETDRDYNRVIDIVHSVILPEPVKLAKGYKWIGFSEVHTLEKNSQEIIFRTVLAL